MLSRHLRRKTEGIQGTSPPLLTLRSVPRPSGALTSRSDKLSLRPNCSVGLAERKQLRPNFRLFGIQYTGLSFVMLCSRGTRSAANAPYILVCLILNFAACKCNRYTGRWRPKLAFGKFRKGHWLSILRAFVFFLGTFRNMPRYYLKLPTTASFQILRIHQSSHHSTLHSVQGIDVS
jgi:hypothetical protein